MAGSGCEHLYGAMTANDSKQPGNRFHPIGSASRVTFPPTAFSPCSFLAFEESYLREPAYRRAACLAAMCTPLPTLPSLRRQL